MTVENNLRFPGQYEDGETGFYYNFQRYYDPVRGRYTQVDPIGFAGGDLNLYGYANNRPINLLDYLGLKTTYKLSTIGLQVVAGGEIGTAIAFTDCVNGKHYEAEYIVLGGSLGVNASLKTNKAVEAVFKAAEYSNSIVSGEKFVLESNYPDFYVSYVDLQGPGASFLYGANFIDISISAYKDGRKDVNFTSSGMTGDISAQIFNFKRINLIRRKIEEVDCCE